LAGFFLLLAWLTQTGDLALLINPHFKSLTELAAYLLLAMSVVQATQIYPKSSIHNHTSCCSHNHNGSLLPFILTLLVAFLLPNNSLDANVAANKGLNFRLSGDTGSALAAIPRPLAETLATTQLIQVTDINFTEVMFEVNSFPTDYVGKEIEITGFVLKDATMAPTQFALARYVIVCCSADASPYGLLCNYTTTDYPADTWLTIRGTIQLENRRNKKLAVVNVTTAKPVPKPARPYIYPSM
jgi:putative membrane protein